MHAQLVYSTFYLETREHTSHDKPSLYVRYPVIPLESRIPPPRPSLCFEHTTAHYTHENISVRPYCYSKIMHEAAAAAQERARAHSFLAASRGASYFASYFLDAKALTAREAIATLFPAPG